MIIVLNAIRIAIEDRVNKEGGIETWIIPNYKLNELQKSKIILINLNGVKA